MKKFFMIALALFFAVTSAAMAANNVANVSQKGSLMIFPMIDISEDKDTVVSISNDYFQPVELKCYWVDSDQTFQDFMFKLTANQPIAFSAKFGLSLDTPKPVTVPPFHGDVGQLACFATNDAQTNQISFNHLMGSAKVVDFGNETAYEYNAWSFQARKPLNTAVGTGGVIKLDGLDYDACPTFYNGNFISSLSNYGFYHDTDLVLVPCKSDLRQDRDATVTKAQFEVWNENETKYTGSTACVKCWFEGLLSGISSHFTTKVLHTFAGRFRVTGVASKVCNPLAASAGTTVQASPLIGLLVEQLDFGYGSKTDQRSFITTASEGFGAGMNTTGFLKYDTGPPEVPESIGPAIR